MPKGKRKRTSTTCSGKSTSDKQADDSKLERESSPITTAEKVTVQQSSDLDKPGFESAPKQSDFEQSSVISKPVPQNVTNRPEIASEPTDTIALETQDEPKTQPASEETFLMSEAHHQDTDLTLNTADADQQSRKSLQSSPKTTSSLKMEQIWGTLPSDLHNFLLRVSKSTNATHFLKFLEEEKARYSSPEYREENKEIDYTYGELLEEAMKKVPIKTDTRSLLEALEREEAFRSVMLECLTEETCQLIAESTKAGKLDITITCGNSVAADMNHSDANRESESDGERKVSNREESPIPYVSFIHLGKNRTNDALSEQTDEQSDLPYPELLSGPQQKKLRTLAVRAFPERGRLIFDCRPTWCQDLSTKNQDNRFVAIQGGSICSAFPRSLCYNRCGCLFIPHARIHHPSPTSTAIERPEELQTSTKSEIGDEMSTSNSYMDSIDEELYNKLQSLQINSETIKVKDEFDTFRRVYPCHSYISRLSARRTKPWEYRTEDDMFPTKEIEEQRRVSEQRLLDEQTAICGIWHRALHLAYNMYRHRGAVQTTALTMRNMQEFLLRVREMELQSQDKDRAEVPRLRIAIHDDDEEPNKPGYPFFGRPGHLFPTIMLNESSTSSRSTSSSSDHDLHKDDVEPLSTNTPESNTVETSPTKTKSEQVKFHAS